METSPPPKTSTCSNIYSYRGTRFTATPFTLLLIPSTLSTASSTAATSASIENVKVYLVIAEYTPIFFMLAGAAAVLKAALGVLGISKKVKGIVVERVPLRLYITASRSLRGRRGL